VKPSWRKAVSAAVSVAMLLPVATLVSTLLLGVIMQTEMSRRAAANAADLKAEEAKKLLRVTILRGPSNESLVNIYAAGKLPIQVDYLIAEGYDGSVIAERNEIISGAKAGGQRNRHSGLARPRPRRLQQRLLEDEEGGEVADTSHL
jgi:hypothetical protein